MSHPDIYLCYSLNVFGYGYSALEAYAEWSIAPEPHPPWCSGGCCNPEEAQ